MDDMYKQILRQNHVILIEDLEISKITDHLIAKEHFSCEEVAQVNVKETRTDKNRRFLETLIRKGPNAFDEFMILLKHTHLHLYEKMESTRSSIEQSSASSTVVDLVSARLQDATRLSNNFVDTTKNLLGESDKTIPESLEENTSKLRQFEDYNCTTKGVKNHLQQSDVALNETKELLAEEQREDAASRAEYGDQWTMKSSEQIAQSINDAITEHRTGIHQLRTEFRDIEDKYKKLHRSIERLRDLNYDIERFLDASIHPGQCLDHIQELRSLMIRLNQIEEDRTEILNELSHETLDQADPLFDELKHRSDESISNGRAICDRIQVVNKYYMKAKKENQQAPTTREDLISSLNENVTSFLDLRQRLAETSKSCSEKARLTMEFNAFVKGYVYTRNAEREEHIKDLNIAAPVLHQPLVVGDTKSNMWIYGSDNQWTAIESNPFKLKWYSACVSPDGFIVSGGVIGSRNTKATCFEFVVRDRKWKTLPPMKTSRRSHSSVHNQDTLLVIGGVHKQSRISSVECLRSSQWSPLPDLAVAVTVPYVVTPLNRLFVMGGWESNDDFSLRVFEFDYSSSQWQPRVSMPDKCTWGASVSHMGRVFILRGEQNHCMSYDVRGNSWVNLRRPPVSMHRGVSNAFMHDETIVVCGGSTSVIEEYRLQSEDWSTWSLIMPTQDRIQFALKVDVDST
ncbi:hypothetical protein CAPTEDRAFT_202583 [Capitella teleta]|uniref:CARD domain-containing protein n=1 Tax=Capitella teleta TaxID=283909 RepID=R7V9Y3_CAPTE|nr:hypothetical protein CAPTEDRAFT_202583 [Capitella teleta]|eukprot:ELU13141.1 hypothetical protein CAPTEDRAFT_202583 [Capitella teleta]